METNAKNWLESRLVENDGCQGNIDATIRLAKLWKSLQEEIPPLHEKTTDCIAFGQKGETIVVSQEKLDGLWDEIKTRKSKITAIEAAAQKLIEIDGRRLCQILQERAELQRKASMGPSAESMVQRIYARNSGRYSLDEIRKMPVVEEEARREETVCAPLRPLVLDAKRKVEAYTEILTDFVKMD